MTDNGTEHCIDNRDFSHRNLTGTSFRGMELSNCNFTGCDLTDADFSNTYLKSCNFRAARINRTNFTNSIWCDLSFSVDCLGVARVGTQVLLTSNTRVRGTYPHHYSAGAIDLSRLPSDIRIHLTPCYDHFLLNRLTPIEEGRTNTSTTSQSSSPPRFDYELLQRFFDTALNPEPSKTKEGPKTIKIPKGASIRFRI